MGFWTRRKIDLNFCRRGVALSRWVLLALCLIAWPPIAFAQSDLVVDPRLLEFTPSPDHATILRYELEVLPDTGTTVPVTVLNLGKPTPAADGQIRVDLTPWHLDTTLPAGTYRSRVTATSAAGSAPSTASNPFTFSVATACTYTLSATSASYPATASSGTVSVTASGSTCAWTSSSSVSWITVTGSATGNGTATLMIQANTATTARTGTVTIAGQTFTVTQAAATSTAPTPTTSTCRVDLSAGSEQLPAGGASNWSVQLTTTTDCAWTAVSTVSWVTVLTPTGTGSGPIRYDVAANPTSAARSGGIVVGPWTFVINQAAGTGTAPASSTCTYTLGATSQSVPAAGGANSVAVSTTSGCAWTASSPVSWITLGATTGTGTANLSYNVAANTATTTRSAVLTVAGQSLTVTQAAATAPCTFSLSSGSQSVPAAGGANSVGLTTQAGCAWTASSPVSWITLGSPSGTGSATVNYTVAANTATTGRSATLTIAGRSLSVSQAAASAPCTYSISPTSRSVAASSSTNSVSVTASTGCAWTASSGASWITLSTTGGNGSANVSYTVAANTSTSSRTGTLTIAGQTHTVTQSGAASTCRLDLSAGRESIPASGANNWAVWVTTTAGCPWTAVSTASWITVLTPSGTGSSAIYYSVAPNPTSTSRSAGITVGPWTFVINQAGR